MTLTYRRSLILPSLLDKPFQVEKEPFFSRNFWPWLPTERPHVQDQSDFCTPALKRSSGFRGTNLWKQLYLCQERKRTLPPGRLLPAELSAALPAFCGRGVVAAGRLPGRLPVLPPRLCGDAPAAPGEQGGGWEPNRSLAIVPGKCQSKSPWESGAVWLSKRSSSSRLQKMCIIRKTRGEKLSACRATLQEGSSVTPPLREHLELERSGSHICQNTSPSAGRTKQSGFQCPCHTPEFCPDGAHSWCLGHYSPLGEVCL